MDMPKSRRSLLAQFRFDVFLTEKKQDNEGGGGGRNETIDYVSYVLQKKL